MEGDAADELDVEVDHFPEEWVVIDGDDGSAHAAGGVFDDGVGFGEDAFEVFGAEFWEFRFGFVEGGFGGFDRFRGGEDLRWQRREFIAEGCEAGFDGLGGVAEFISGHEFDERFRRGVEDVVAGEKRLPIAGHFADFLLRLPLESFFDFADAGDGRADAAHFALVFAADDFLEDPLDHLRDGVWRKPAGSEAILTESQTCKCETCLLRFL